MPVEPLELEDQQVQQAFKVPVVLELRGLVVHLELPGHPVLEAQRVQQALKGQREPEQQVRRGQQVQLEFRELRGLGQLG